MTRTVRDYMTPAARTIGADQPMAAAHRAMRARRIRHLPVLERGRLVGIVTERDLHLVETLRDVDPDRVPVEEAMTPDPYAVAPDTPLVEVVEAMARRKLGSAVVVDGGRVVGMFTVVDALQALAELLRRRRPVVRKRAAGSGAGRGSRRPGGGRRAGRHGPVRN